MKKILLFSFIAFSSLFSNVQEEKPMVLVIPSYNNTKWHQLNLESIFSQKYNNFRIIYLDDASPDKTGEQVEALVLEKTNSFHKFIFDDTLFQNITEATQAFQEKANEKKSFFTLVCNAHRNGALANQYRAIYSCNDEEIIVTVDGDDWLADDEVLKRLNETYSRGEIWMTHGKLIEHPSGAINWCEPIPAHIIESNSFRRFKCPSHMRTYYAWIFKKIDLEDLLYDGNFFSMTCDMAIMFPIAEMAGERHAFITQPNYIYNMESSINDNKVNASLQRMLDQYIRNKKPYRRLEKNTFCNK